MDYTNFLQIIWNFYEEHGRAELPWRSDTSMYAITVSELMLQQTQVNRVVPKFIEFMNVFPNFKSLATADQSEVVLLWQGLGYNRRARYLHQSAKIIVNEWKHDIPRDQKTLIKLPGIGWNTAGAILAYAFNQPTIFIETNIRAVYIHHFFTNQDEIKDDQLVPHIKATLDHADPRHFYWALMDYGSHLKRTQKNPARRSKHHVKQLAFEGSFRQIRSSIIKQLTQSAKTKSQLQDFTSDERLEAALTSLVKDGLIHKKDERYHL